MEIRCLKCKIGLETLKKKGMGDYMIKIADENGEYFVCKSCFQGWTD
ncbi:hypothetical protein ACFLQN_01750 [Candidatus Aenigmatarchaeota archaeon]